MLTMHIHTSELVNTADYKQFPKLHKKQTRLSNLKWKGDHALFFLLMCFFFPLCAKDAFEEERFLNYISRIIKRSPTHFQNDHVIIDCLKYSLYTSLKWNPESKFWVITPLEKKSSHTHLFRNANSLKA